MYLSYRPAIGRWSNTPLGTAPRLLWPVLLPSRDLDMSPHSQPLRVGFFSTTDRDLDPELTLRVCKVEPKHHGGWNG